jgi:hypothetical protein
LTGQLVRSSRQTARRYERDRPGELVHMDVKKIGNIPDGGGWRLHGRPGTTAEKMQRPKIGYDYSTLWSSRARREARKWRTSVRLSMPSKLRPEPSVVEVSASTPQHVGPSTRARLARSQINAKSSGMAMADEVQAARLYSV